MTAAQGGDAPATPSSGGARPRRYFRVRRAHPLPSSMRHRIHRAAVAIVRSRRRRRGARRAAAARMLFCGPGNVPGFMGARATAFTRLREERVRSGTVYARQAGSACAALYPRAERAPQPGAAATDELIGPPADLSICRTHTPPAIARVPVPP